MIYGLNPIDLTKSSIDEWKKASSDNIVVYVQKSKEKVEVFLLKRKFFLDAEEAYGFSECIYSDTNQLMIAETAKNKYFNLGHFIGEQLLSKCDASLKNLKGLGTNKSQDYLVTYIDKTKFISKDALRRAHIKLFKGDMKSKYNCLYE